MLAVSKHKLKEMASMGEVSIVGVDLAGLAPVTGHSGSCVLSCDELSGRAHFGVSVMPANGGR